MCATYVVSLTVCNWAPYRAFQPLSNDNYCTVPGPSADPGMHANVIIRETLFRPRSI